MSEAAIFTNMVMIYQGESVLVQNRLNPNWPGLTFPGGHVLPKEPFVTSAIREVKEETGLTISQLELCGIKQFQTNKGDRYVVFLYKTSNFVGTLTSSDEGEVLWLNRQELSKLNTASGFMEMLAVFEQKELSEFYFNSDSEEAQIKLL